ncbi:hypothetical protein O9929_24570 [Vibrio lentus]|nr:hypothetical protein [Vibrio lentus]
MRNGEGEVVVFAKRLELMLLDLKIEERNSLVASAQANEVAPLFLATRVTKLKSMNGLLGILQMLNIYR